jgi:hypothetical protein
MERDQGKPKNTVIVNTSSNAQKYSIVTESMDILTVRLSQSLKEQQVCVRERGVEMLCVFDSRPMIKMKIRQKEFLG